MQTNKLFEVNNVWEQPPHPCCHIDHHFQSHDSVFAQRGLNSNSMACFGYTVSDGVCTGFVHLERLSIPFENLTILVS